MAGRAFSRLILGFGTLASLLLVLSLVPSAGGSGVSTPPVMMVRAGTTDVVYVVAKAGCALKCLRMYRTNMEGTSFSRVSLPRNAELGASNLTLNDVSFANAQDGYAFVGLYDPSVIYATTNGARSWHRLVTPKDLYGPVHVTNAGLFAVTANCASKNAVCKNYRVWHAVLDAKKWTALPSLWQTGPGHQYYGPSVAGFQNMVWEVETANSGDYLWTSTNHGRTFTVEKERFPVLISTAGCTLEPMSTTSLWAECPGGMGVLFWHSDDGGATWREVNDSRYQFMGTGGGAFEPLSANVAIIDFGGTTRHPNLFRVTDGGAHFAPITELSCLNASPLIFQNAQDGLVLCSTYNSSTVRLLRTRDGGVTWRNVALPRTTS